MIVLAAALVCTRDAASQSTYAVGWTDLPNTSLQSVCPANGFRPEVSDGKPYPYSSQCKNVINAWNSGIADTTHDKLYIWGGGHSDYGGNEIYALDLTTKTISRLNDPSGPAAYDAMAGCYSMTSSVFPFTSGTTENNWAYPDGRPNSRHTAAGLTFIPTIDKMFSFNGGVACGNGIHFADTWMLDLNNISNTGTGGWQQMDPTNGLAFYNGLRSGNVGSNWWSVAAYDPNSDTVIVQIADTLNSYNYRTNTYTKLGNVHLPVSANAVIDPKRKLLISFGIEWPFGSTQNANYFIKKISLTSPYTVTDVTSLVTGCFAPPALSSPASWSPWFFPGMAYDPVVDRTVLWPNQGNTVYLFNPDTNSCVMQTLPGTPPAVGNLSQGNGALGRFAYFPDLDVFALVADAGQDAYILKIDNTGAASTSDTQPPTVSMTAPANGSTVSGSVTFSTTASDNVGVIGVQFKVDGANVGSQIAAPPYSVSWNSTTVTNGSHAVTAIASDAAGNTTTAAAVTVTVSNAVQPPSPPPPSALALTGLGGSTFTCLDLDGDSYGVGPGCAGIDADDTDASVHTGAQAIAKYGSLSAFLSHLGYNPPHIWYLAPATASPAGNNTTGVRDDPTHPFLTQPVTAAGDMLMLRDGWNGRMQPPSGTATTPTIVMSYPGEQAVITGAAGNNIVVMDVAYITIDGVKLANFSQIAGGTHDGASSILLHDITMRHIDGSQASDAPIQLMNGLGNITIESSVFHDNNCGGGSCQHGVYLGSRGLASNNVTVRRNLFYDNAWSGFHFNGRVTNLVFDQNIVYNNGSSGLSLQQGVNHSFIRSNLIFNNTNAMQFYNYQGACLDPTQGNAQYICPYDQNYNLIENNVLYNTGMDAFDQTTAQGNPTIQIQNDTTGCPYSTGCVAPQVPTKQGDLGHNTYRNNIIVGWGNTSGAPNYYHPSVQAISCQAGTSAYFGGTCVFDNTETYLATSTFENNIFWEVGTYPDSNIIGWGPLGYGYNAYNCSTAKTITNIAGACTSTDPQFVKASASLWNAATTFNFQLQSSSPAIHAGSVTAVPAYDIVGNIFGNPPSVGAYEAMPGTTPGSVSVYPATASLFSGQSQQFTASVTGGSGNTAVTWSTSPNVGTISSTGLYTAPATVAAQQNVIVTATSMADPSKSASSTISLVTFPAQGLIGYWSFDEGSGAIAHDVSGNSYDATINGASWVAGESNSGLGFNGRTSYAVTPAIALTNSFSISAWVNPAVTTQKAYTRIAETRFDVGLYLGTDISGRKYKFIINAGAGSTSLCGIGFGCVEGGVLMSGWHLVTGTFDGTVARLYVDGLLVAMDTFTAPAKTNYPLYIGRYFGSSGYVWNGAIDEIYLFDRALTSAEVSVLYDIRNLLK